MTISLHSSDFESIGIPLKKDITESRVGVTFFTRKFYSVTHTPYQYNLFHEDTPE